MRISEEFHRARMRYYSRHGWAVSSIERLGFDIVHGCQLRCIGCPNSTLERKVYKISIEEFRRCLGNIDVQRVHLFRLFNFGEPLLHPDLPGIISEVSKQRFAVDILEISTNAQYHDFKMLTEAIKLNTLSRIAVSCDGDGTPEEYERLRPPAKWERLLEFLSKTMELRNKYAPDLRLMTRTICTSEEGQRRWKELLLPLGWVPEFRGWLALPDSIENRGDRPPAAPRRICSYMRGNSLYVDADGTVVPCCVHPIAFGLGNLMQQPFNEIRRSERRKHLMRQLKTGRDTMQVCKRCGY